MMFEKLRGRSGMTLLEVMLSLGIFLIGSVGIIGLFVTAGALHAEAVRRRTAANIAQELLAEVRAAPLREVFAKTNVYPPPGGGGGDSGGTIAVYSVNPEAQYQTAAFDRYPLSETANRNSGFLLLEGSGAVSDELAYYGQVSQGGAGPPDQLVMAQRDIVGGGGVHDDDSRVLSPRTWNFCLQDGDPGAAGDNPLDDTSDTFTVYDGSPANFPPAEGYLVMDEEWMPYEWDSTNQEFTVRDIDGDGTADRGWGNTEPTSHKVGTPVTIAREHDRHDDFYYAVQYYPVNATGAEAKVIISVGYGNDRRFRVHTFHTIYTPSKY